MKHLRTAALVALVGLSLSARAGDFDGSKDLLCASQLAVDCGREGECEEGLPDSLNIPSFFAVSLQENAIRATRPDQSSIDAPIKSKTVENGQLLLQGSENGRGWTAAISQTSGNLVVSVAGEDVAFVIFGACSVKP